ncbi:MAG: FkbM family methyltransferase [Hyphomicrobiales bacterium]|nr:FkbM family methyltransferase [Hyphomicrobiales bacterium]
MNAGLGATLLENREVRLKATRHGLMLYHSKDAYVGRSFDLYGEFSEGEIGLFRQLLQPGSVVLDIGANIGAHTLYFAAAVAPGGGVIAYEPQRAIHQMLCANLALNGITNVRALLAGAGRERGIAQVPVLDYTAANNFGGISLGMGGPSEPVDIVPVDALGLGRCDLMKIDVEGMEGEVVAGAGATIARFRPMLYVENDRREKSAALIEQLLSLGYELFWHLPSLFNPQNFFGQAANVFEGIVSINMLGVPREAKHNVSGFHRVGDPEDWPLAKGSRA